MEMHSTKDTFERVYRTHRWGADGGGSGPGSTCEQSVGASRVLFYVIVSLNLNSVVDAACGAMTWQSNLLPQLLSLKPSLRYVGLDAAQRIINQNNLMFRQYHPNVRFEHVELENVVIPQTDLIFSRDTMQHNTIKGVAQILHRFVQSNASHVLTTSYPNGSHYCKGPVRQRNRRSLARSLAAARRPRLLCWRPRGTVRAIPRWRARRPPCELERGLLHARSPPPKIAQLRVLRAPSWSRGAFLCTFSLTKAASSRS